MASLALGIAGAAVGSAFGPLGASVGWMVGSAIGGMLDPQKIEGPRLGDLRLHTSSYGVMTPRIWGSMRTAGNIIDEQPELTEHSETSGGKGGPETTAYTYSASFAVRICKGPIEGVTRIWANGRTIYDVRGGTPTVGEDLPFTLYLGTEEQLPDPTLEAIHGAGNVPGYRGVAYIVFTDLMLGDFGNALPNLEFEVATKAHSNGPITKYKENQTTGFVFTEDFSGFFGDYPYKNYPVVEQWPLDSGELRIAALDFTGFQVTPVTAYTPVEVFDSADLTFIDHDLAPMALVQPWAVDYGAGHVNYNPLGLYRASSTITTALWWRRQVVTGSGFDPPIGDQFMTEYGDNLHIVGTDYAASWGVTLGEILETVAMTATGDRLLLFTSPTGTPPGGSGITKWYEIRANAVSRSGTVSPALSVGGLGAPAVIQTTLGACSSLESNGRYLWAISFMGGGFGGNANVYEIDPVTLNLAVNTTCGTCSVNVTDGTHLGTAYSMQPGYCGWAGGGDNLIVFTRFPEGETLQVLLSEIVGDISELCGLDPTEFDVSTLTDLVDGYLVAQQGTGRDWVQFLRNAYFFDGVESDDTVKFVKRGQQSVVTLDDEELAAHVYGEDAPPILATVRTDDVQLPAIVNLSHVNAEADYQTGTQRARRQVTHSEAEIALDLPINMTPVKARAVAETQLYMAEVERNRHTFYTSRARAVYEPTDVITVQDKAIRVTEKSEVRAGVIKFDGVASLAEVVLRSRPANPQIDFTPSPPAPADAGPTEAMLFDLPLIEDGDDPEGFYAGMRGDAPWPGATLFKSSDAGASYPDAVASTSTPNVLGATTTLLGDFAGGNTFDETNLVTVVVGADQELASVSELAVLNGANECVIADEVLQFKNAELVDTDTYELSGLLRGRRGTEWAMSEHTATDDFALLPLIRAESPIEELYQERTFKPVTFGKTLASAVAQTFTNNGAALRPYAPVLLGGGCDAAGNVTVNWTRRTRIGGAWLPYVDVPLAESSESYVVQYWNSTYTLCARNEVVAVQTAEYSSADQVTDFGAQQQTIYFTVQQIGSVGLGTEARGTAPGAGGSSGAPLVPIPPYGT